MQLFLAHEEVIVHYFSHVEQLYLLTCMHDVRVLNIAKIAGKMGALSTKDKCQTIMSQYSPHTLFLRNHSNFACVKKGEEECSCSSMGDALQIYVQHGK